MVFPKYGFLPSGAFLLLGGTRMSGVNIKIRADARQAQNEISKINKSMGNLDQQARKATDTFRRLAIGITAAFGASAFTKGISRAADSMTMLENRTRLVTKTARQTTATLNELFNVAARSGSDVDAVAETFNRFGLALKDSRKPIKELLLVTEAVQQAAAISGSGAQSAKAAIIQLGQGLASGQLRGQELNSVLEQMPRLAQAIADGMGIPFGKLREEAMAGKVTAEAVYSAILKGAKDIDSEFKTLEFTTGQFAVIFANELKRAVAVFDDVTGFSDDIKVGLKIGADAARFFAQNFRRYIQLAGLELMVLKSDLRFFATDFKSFFSDLFSGDFDAKSFVDGVAKSIDNVKASMKEKFTVVLNFTTEKVDLIKDKFPGINDALTALTNFKDAVIRIFEEIVDRVLRRSPWTGLFDPNHEEPGAPAIGNTKFMWKWLSKALNALTAFKNSVIDRFKSINIGATEKWAELRNSIETKGITVTISEQTENVWNSLRTSYNELIQYLSTKEIDTPSGLQMVETNFGLAIRRIKEQYNSLADSILKDEVFVEGLGQNGGEFVQVEAAWIKSFRSGLDEAQGYFDSFVELLKNTPLVIGITVLATSIKENFDKVSEDITTYFDENSDQLAAAVSASIAFFLSQKLRGIVLGPALATAFLASAGTLGNNQEFLDAAKKVATGFGKAIKDVFSDDGDDVVADILDGLKNLASTVADGFLEGLFGPEFENDVVQKLTTALVIATGAFILAPGLVTSLGNIALKISSVMFGARWAGYLADGFVIGITDAADMVKGRKRIQTALENLGLNIGQGIRKGAFGLIAGGILGYQINELFDIDQTSTEGIGVTIATSIGTGILSYALYDSVAALVARVGASAGVIAASTSLGGTISGFIAAGIAAAPFAIIAAVGAAIGLAVVKGVTYFNDREISKNASINLSLGVSTALDRASLGRANAKLKAPLDKFIAEISDTAEDNINKGLVGAELIDATFANDIVNEFEKKLNDTLKKRGVFEDPTELTEALRLNFPGFQFDEAEVKNMAEMGYLDLSELLTKGTLFKKPIDIAPDLALSAESKVDLDTIRNSLLDAGAANAGDILAETLTKISESPIITPEQLTSLDQGSTAIEKLASAFERLGQVVRDATGFSFSFNNTKSVMDNYSTSAFSSGGRVSGAGTGTSDDIPAMLSNGEYVMQQSAVQKFGPDFMDAVNSGTVPQFRNGGGSIGDLAQLATSAGTGIGAYLEGKTFANVLAELTGTSDENVTKQVNTLLPELASIMNEPMTAPNTVAELESITGANVLVNPNGVVDYVASRAALSSGSFAYENQGGLVGLVDAVLSRMGLELPYLPETLSDVLPFAADSLKLASGVMGFLGDSQVKKWKPKIRAVDAFLMSQSEDKQRGALRDSFFQDGLPEFPRGALYGGVAGVSSAILGSGFKVIKGLGKTLSSLAKGDIRGAGLGALSSVGTIAKTVAMGGVIGAAVQGAIGSVVGGSIYTLTGMINGLFADSKQEGFPSSGVMASADPQYFNSGGSVSGPGTSTSDGVPAMLSNGEYVMQASAVRKFGPGFMASINAGIAPIFRAPGGDTKSAASILGVETESSTSATIRRVLAQIRQAEGRRDAVGAEEAVKLRQALQDLYEITAEQVAVLEEGGEGAKAVVGNADANKKRQEAIKDFTEEFKNELASGLSYALKTGDFKGALNGILDTFTSKIIDNFASNFADSLTSGFDFEKIFDAFGSGGTGGGFGGGLGSLIKSGLGWLNIPGFSQGGVVPSTPFSQAGKDSVPILAMPGEVVLSRNDVRNMESNKGSNTQSFNINVQGDVSRQTRREIVKMIPQITSGVNSQNKESNYRR
jgi:tape measure domain-containing protein